MYGTTPSTTAQPKDNVATISYGAVQPNTGFSPSNPLDTVDVDQENVNRRKRIYSHCHVQSGDRSRAANNVDRSARRRLIAASIICLLFMIGEITGGILSNSLAIAADAAHLLTDLASFAISLFAIWLSSRPASKKMSFGWYRAEVIGALISVLMIWLVTAFLVYMAVQRLRTGEIEIDAQVMVITAAAGLLVNIIMALALNVDGHFHFHAHGHSHGHGHSHHSHLHEDEDEEVDHFSERQPIDLGQKHPGESTNLSKRNTNSNNLVGSQSLVLSHHQDSSTKLYDNINIEPQGTTASNKNNSKSTNSLSALSDRNGSQDSIISVRDDGSHHKNECHGRRESRGRGKSNINVRAAFIHVIGDFLQSLGVLVASLVIYFEPSYAIVDPICTFLFSIIVLVTTINILRDATNVLMEGMPDGINFIEVREKLQDLPYVIRVHNLRIWSLSLDKIAISTHLVIDSSRTSPSYALKSAIDTLKSSYNFLEVTIQIEEYRDDMKDCEHCQDEEVVITVANQVAG